MAVNSTIEFYDWMMEKRDPRVEDWLLMKTPLTTAVFFFLYLFVVWAGPAFMRNRKPLQLKQLLILYNLGLVVLSVYMFYEFLTTSLMSNYSYICQPVDYSSSPLAMRMASVCWWFFFSKVIELLDTVFFILRKKNDQITFLHVYHHCSMIINWWLGARFVAGGQSFFVAMLNSFVHIFMYTYYGLAAIGPHMQKYLWWKRYLTRMQLLCNHPPEEERVGCILDVISLSFFAFLHGAVGWSATQFVAFVVHTGFNILTECDFPKGYSIAVFLYAISLIILFGNFYYQTYNKKARQKFE